MIEYRNVAMMVKLNMYKQRIFFSYFSFEILCIVFREPNQSPTGPGWTAHRNYVIKVWTYRKDKSPKKVDESGSGFPGVGVPIEALLLENV